MACGASSEFPLVYFKMAAVMRDTTQTSSSIHTLDAVYNAKYLCGNIITIQIYWQWQQGIRASLCVPQDERVFLSLAPEVLRGMDCVKSWQRPRSTKTPRRRQWEAGRFNRRQGREEMWKCVEKVPIRTINMHTGCWLESRKLNIISVLVVTQEFSTAVFLFFFLYWADKPLSVF